MTGWTTLVQAETLHDALGRDGLVLLDARSSLGAPGAAEAAYREAHLPGARFIDLDHDMSDHALTGGRHPWPDADRFTAALQRLGVRPDDQVVAYDAGDGALAAARVWFMLRLLGHRSVAVLDGGLTRWTALGLPVECDVPTPEPSEYRAEFDASRLLDAPAVERHLAGAGTLVDARAMERFRGDVEPLDRVAGHVPGAVNRPYAANLRDGRFKPAEELAREFDALLGDAQPADLVAMCGSGVTACHHLLAMEHAGRPGAKLFTGSWSGWIEDPRRPVAQGD
ncbi:sulfurtransferase [Cognatilysobacter bugurensis]|uniref:Thiosulfate sulfurtransferase n=1 Tax=Cognatilysobacter bugurensis TaxID=543356 RepID=A0A918W6W0_9GAMM|nr:sulfurtransferase [Lysobacter bugurensis]GHA75131.1 thiosulfate sulfurtransferase [Lysobacter bugurensis]